MKDYGKMSDFEINSAVHNIALDLGYRLEFIGNGVVKWSNGAEVITTTYIGYQKNGLHDYCNNPSDAWPIIHGNDIMLNPNCADELWKAEQGFREKPSGFYDVATAYNKNPLRAAMIVYLMMKDEEK